MLAARIVNHEGPPGAIEIGEVPEPRQVSPQLRGAGEPVEIAVRAASAAFPELLQSRGMYQYQPELPFIPGAEMAGRVISAPPGSALEPGQPVFAHCQGGAFAERVIAPSMLTFGLPEKLDFAEGAAVFSNYHTAYFSLFTRGRCREGEKVLVHGAAGGVGSATLQVAKGLGLETVAVVSSDEKAEIARGALADHVLRSDGSWKDEALELTGGLDIVIDTVGDRTVENLRALREGGRLVIVGFASGEIPLIKANRLLLRNIEVVGAGYGAYVYPKPEVCVEIGGAIAKLIDAGFVRPVIGARFPLERTADALSHLDRREAMGKVIIDVSDDG